MAENDCCCGDRASLLYTCSGAANTGFLADAVTRRHRDLGIGKMTCLAALGAELSGFVESARSANVNIVVEGCPTSCGKSIFENLGIPHHHLIMTEFGVEKGKTKISSELIEKITTTVAEGISCECNRDTA